MKLSMIVVTTSWAPVEALSTPGMKPQTAPAAMPASSASGDRQDGGPSAQRDADGDGASGAEEELARQRRC